MNKLFLIILATLSIVPISSVYAETAEGKGEAIIIEVDKRNTGWKTSQSQMKMVLRNKRGEETIRKIRIKSLEVENDGDKGLTIFDEPKDVKGTAFLTYSHALKADEQWIFLPALKRVKRISSSNKSGPFMGSEFSYEDISSFEVEKYSFKYLRDEKVENFDTFVVELVPLYKHSGYTKQIVWVDKKDYIFRKTEFYDRKKSLLKTLVFSNHEQYLGKYWRALTMDMVNHQRGKSTTLLLSNFKFGMDLKDSDFNKSNLKRAR